MVMTPSTAWQVCSDSNWLKFAVVVSPQEWGEEDG